MRGKSRGVAPVVPIIHGAGTQGSNPWVSSTVGSGRILTSCGQARRFMEARTGNARSHEKAWLSQRSLLAGLLATGCSSGDKLLAKRGPITTNGRRHQLYEIAESNLTTTTTVAGSTCHQQPFTGGGNGQ